MMKSSMNKSISPFPKDMQVVILLFDMFIHQFLLILCHRYIEEEDLLRFLHSEEVNTIFPLFEGAIETGRITKSSFRNWVVKLLHAYNTITLLS